MRLLTYIILSLMFCVLNKIDCVSADEYFRSDHGFAKDSPSLPSDLNKQAHLLWRTELQPGHSTPCIVGDQIFLTTFDTSQQSLATVALNLATGMEVWKQQAPHDRIEEFHRIGSPATPTPASDGKRVYIFFGSYGLICYDLEGNEIWRRPLGPFQDEFGAGSSPILSDDLVLLCQDHDVNNFLYAFDKQTGRDVWKVPRDEFTRSYATPVLFKTDNQTQILMAGALRLTSYDVTGKALWWVDGLARIVNTMPTHDGKTVYVATWAPGGDPGSRIGMQAWDDAAKEFDKNKDGKIAKQELSDGPVLIRFFRMDINQDESLSKQEWERHAAVFDQAKNEILAIDPSGIGNVTESNIKWKYGRGVPYVASPLVAKDVVFMVKDGGILTSLDAKTGEVGKQKRLPGRGNYYASPVYGDGKIYIASEQGVLSIVSAEADWKIETSIDFKESIYATPVIRDNRIYIRTDRALYCFCEK